MKKVLYFSFLLMVMAATITSCSETRNAMGIDTVNGFIRTGKWTTLTKEVYTSGNTAVKTDILTDSKYIKFEGDGKAHMYDANDNQISTVNYSFNDTKTMMYDGVEYKIQENFVSTVSTMTLVSTGVPKTVLTFKR